MKSNTILKTLSVFLATTALLQVSGISSKLANGSSIVQVNAAEEEFKVVSSISIEGNLVEGNTLKVVVKSKDGEDITESASPIWYRIDNPVTPNYQYLNIKDNKYQNLLIYCGKGNTYTLEKEDIGKYIGVIVLGKDPNQKGDPILLNTMNSTTTKVEPNSTHWQKVDDGDSSPSWYYLNDDGSKVTGWKQIGGYWYYFRLKTGSMVNHWKNIDGKWYYFNNNAVKCGSGKMLTGWVKDVVTVRNSKNQIKYYYLYSDGSMASNTTIDGHYLDASGASTDAVDKSLVKN